MRSWKNSLSSICLTALALCNVANSANKPPIALGAWTLDPAKSKYEPGPTPSNAKREYSDAGKGLVSIAVDTQYSDGRTTHATATFAYDGSKHAVSGVPDYDAIVVKRTGSNATRTDLMRDDKVIGHLTTTLSKDGTTLTTDYIFTDKSGSRVHNRGVWHHH